MRRPLIALTAAAVVGTSALAVPPALAAHSAPSQQSSRASAAVSSRSEATRTLAVTTAVSTAARRHTKCSYPTNHPTLSLTPASGRFRHAVRITFHGKLALNKCGLAGQRVRLLSSRGRRVVGGDTTDARGFYSISVRVAHSSAFIAFSSGQHKRAVFSNPSFITIRR